MSQLGFGAPRQTVPYEIPLALPESSLYSPSSSGLGAVTPGVSYHFSLPLQVQASEEGREGEGRGRKGRGRERAGRFC